MARPRSVITVSVHWDGPLSVSALAAIAGKLGSPPAQALIEARRRGRVPAFSITLGDFTFQHPASGGRLEVEV